MSIDVICTTLRNGDKVWLNLSTLLIATRSGDELVLKLLSAGEDGIEAVNKGEAAQSVEVILDGLAQATLRRLGLLGLETQQPLKPRPIPPSTLPYRPRGGDGTNTEPFPEAIP